MENKRCHRILFLQNVPRNVHLFGNARQALRNGVLSDDDCRSVLHLGRVETDGFHDAFQDRVEPSGANVFDRLIQQGGHSRNLPEGLVLKDEIDTLGTNELDLLADEVGHGFRQNLVQIVFSQSCELDADGQTSLQLRKQIADLDGVKGPGGNEQDVVRVHIPVFGIDGRPFDERQQITLDTLGTGIRRSATHSFPGGTNLVDLIDEDDAAFFDGCNGALFEINVF
mmetsp:Transcript_12346/g.25505  ORF Transcript_12346/g.25505 Transcript_12346/m.25505 type:complete len:226 (+) Transcript_12346:237-914(+)